MARWTCQPLRLGWRMASPIFPDTGPPGNPIAGRGPLRKSPNRRKPGDPADITASRQMSEYRRRPSGRVALSTLAYPNRQRAHRKPGERRPPHRCLPDNFLRAYGLPHLLKFVHTPNLLVVLNEMNAGYRQVFTDARPLPKDPTPSWQGYSSGKWSGDTLVSTRLDCATIRGSIGMEVC